MRNGIRKAPRLILRGAFLLLALGCCCAPAARATSIEQQRAWFSEAHQDLQTGRMHAYATLKAKLANYPLTPYLDIWNAWKHLGHGHDAEVAATLKRFADIPEANDLRKAWIENLARRGQWSEVARQLAAHPGLQNRMPGLAIMADWHTGRHKAAMRRYSRAWTHATRLHGVSRALNRDWIKQGHPNADERWARIVHEAKHGRWSRVRALSRHMGKEHKEWLTYWHRLHNRPEREFGHWPASLSHALPAHAELFRAMAGDGLWRLARTDPAKAHARLQAIRQQPHAGIDNGFYDALDQRISLAAARRHLPVAAAWLTNLPVAQQTLETRAWQARLCMLQHDWKGVLQTIGAMPVEQRQLDRWQYWQAYALESEGNAGQARPIFARLAGNRGYYGFLSAAHLGQPYRFDNEALDASPTAILKLLRMPGVLRAREWLALQSYHKAAREWNAALAGSDVEAWKAAAAIASAWNWPDQAIRAANRAGAENALEERFPLQYARQVTKMARVTGLSTSTIWGVIRQESIFNRQAHSRAGARGLMQLLPRTAHRVARRIGMRASRRALYTPSVNIKLGAHYLADLKSRFNDNLALAAAAYNAGPRKVDQWLERTPFDSAAIWVETIPYNETRNYVQHVLAFAIVYQWREKRQPDSLGKLMNDRPQELSLNEISK